MVTPLAGPVTTLVERPLRFLHAIRRALREFIGLPLVVVAGFGVLFAATYALDEALWNPGQDGPQPWLARVFGDSSAISSLLAAVATGMITVTSITFSLLLVAVQQTASTLSPHVYDQFVRRRINKAAFGFFVGLSIFVLFTLGSAGSTHLPVLGALLSLILTGTALCLVVVLIYSTVDQMRPVSVVNAIHGFIKAARAAERRTLETTRRAPNPGLIWEHLARADNYGVVGWIDIAVVEWVLADGPDAAAHPNLEVEIVAVTGRYIATHDPFFRLRSDRALPAAALARIEAAIRAAIRIDPRRTLDGDVGFGIEQLHAIAWTTASTSKQNPQPATLICHCLRDLIGRWAHDEPVGERATSRIVYEDRAVEEAVLALSALGVVSSESMQGSLMAEVWRTLGMLVEHAPPRLLPMLVDTVVRLLSALGDHVMTREVERSLAACETALRSRNETGAADAVGEAARELGRSVGRLNARGTRVPQAA